MKLYLSNDDGNVITESDLKLNVFPLWQYENAQESGLQEKEFTFNDFMQEQERYHTLTEISNDNTIVEDRKTGYKCSLEFALKMVNPEQLEEYATYRDNGKTIHHLLY